MGLMNLVETAGFEPADVCSLVNKMSVFSGFSGRLLPVCPPRMDKVSPKMSPKTGDKVGNNWGTTGDKDPCRY